MRVLIIQFVPLTQGRLLPVFDHGLGVAARGLADEGIAASLLAMDGYRPEALREAVNLHRPNHIVVDIPPTAVAAARHTIADVSEKYFLPVHVVGTFATCQPQRAISIPGVVAVVVGEYERALGELLRRLGEGAVHVGAGEELDVPGVWLNSEDGLVRNEPGPLTTAPDELPMPDRELFETRRAVAVTGEVDFRATFGCPWWCAYCLNDWYMDLYAGKGATYRRRSVGNLLEEIGAVVAECEGIRRLRFIDHPFAADERWMEEFASEYPKRCALPYRCRAMPWAATPAVAAALARSGCRMVDVEIGSGSTFIREEVLGLRVAREQIRSGMAALKQAGLSVRASVFVGAPYETDVSVDETVELLAELAVDSLRARVYYPVQGTRAAEICSENGWISGRGEENFYANRSVLDMPSLSAERIDDLARRLESLVRKCRGGPLRKWIDKARRAARRPLRLGKKKQARQRPDE